MASIDLDAIDRRILERLQRNNKETNQDLAEAVGISPPACLRRVRRLRDAGAVRADVALLAPAVAGKHVTLLVEVMLERERLDIVDSFKRAMKAEPAVTQCWFVTGDPDFVLVIRVADMDAYEGLTRKLFYANPDVAKFKTLVALTEVKFETSVPVAHLSPE